jgi:uncharacterized membrane protein
LFALYFFLVLFFFRYASKPSIRYRPTRNWLTAQQSPHFFVVSRHSSNMPQKHVTAHSSKHFLKAVSLAGILLAGFYPFMYVLLQDKAGLLTTKPDNLLNNPVWKAAFYTHIFGGALAMLSGWSQFLPVFRSKHPAFHRRLGYVYVTAVLFSGFAAVYLAHFATGGIASVSGFLSLGVAWLISTALAVYFIRTKDLFRHKKAMVFSYAATLAALTLRMELPLLIVLTGDFFVAYPIVAWLCWVPNLLLAWWITAKRPYYF